MIKAEISFEGDCIHCNGYVINIVAGDGLYIWIGSLDFISIEQAIQYCLEQSQ